MSQDTKDAGGDQGGAARESFAAFAHRLLDVRTDGGGIDQLLNALADAVAATATPGAGRGELDELGDVLNAGVRPSALGKFVTERMPLLHPYRHQKDGDWKYGTFADRTTLAHRMWAEARAVESSDRSVSVRLSRAAFLLAAQEQAFGGVTIAHQLLADAAFERMTAWPAARIAALRAHAVVEQADRQRFVEHQVAAAADLEILIRTAPIFDSQAFGKLMAQLDAMAMLAPARPDMQWRLANFVWRVTNVLRNGGSQEPLADLRAQVERWSASIADGTADRWFEEALTSPPATIKTCGFKRYSAEELERRRVRDAEPPRP